MYKYLGICELAVRDDEDASSEAASSEAAQGFGESRGDVVEVV
jgi:hypothetical protein